VSRFDRYLLSQLMTLFGFFALVLVGVYWINRAVRLFDQLISDGQSAWVFLEFTALTLPSVIRLMLPVAALVATIYATNRLSNESELAVMQATGFSPFRLARPVVFFGLVVTAMVSVLTHVLEPMARRQLAERRGEIAANVTSRFLVEGAFMHPAEGVTFFIGQITPQGELREIFLNDSRKDRRQTTYTARRAALVRGDDGPKLVMFDGMAQSVDRQTDRLSVTRFANFAYDIGALIEGPADRSPVPEERPTAELLWPDEAQVAQSGSSRAAFLLEGHDRIAQPLMAVTASLIAFASLLLGGFSRFGLWRQIGVAIGLVIVVQFLSNSASRFALRDAAAWPAIYLPTAVGLSLASLLLALSAMPRKVPRGGTATAPA
jgi:lipopolysaccharide export system permease protein